MGNSQGCVKVLFCIELYTLIRKGAINSCHSCHSMHNVIRVYDFNLAVGQQLDKEYSVDDLVQRLATGDHPVTVGGPNPSLENFKQSIDRDYIHIKFTQTRGGTDLGIKLDRGRSSLGEADFERGDGHVHVEGTLTLNYVPVRCVANIDLSTLDGQGHLEILAETAA
jgi:hypothetical protein